jgi:hypothetical protein
VATADVTITVKRNANMPRFLSTEYRKQVDENAVLGEPIVNVTAVDDDQVNTFITPALYYTIIFMNSVKLVP